MPRRNRSFNFVVLIILLLISQLSLAWPVPDTGQTKCYDGSGNEITCPQPGEPFYCQDGNYTINPPSYTKLDVSGNALPDSATSWVMVRDNVTGLIWEVKTNDGSVHDRYNTYTWYDSQGVFIAALNASNFGGYSDWRLPTIKELDSLVNLSSAGGNYDQSFFPGGGYTYWSSTTNANNTELAWLINFSGGDDFFTYKSNNYYAWAVRGEEKQNFFVDNGDGTVTDTSTRLMWQKDATLGTYNWEDALSYCETLTLSGYPDWRLPTRKELRSIVNYDRYNPSIDTVIFPGTTGDFYWSSTTTAYLTNRAWSILFNSGIDYGGAPEDDYDGLKSTSYYVRAVRGGQSIISQVIYLFQEGDTPTGSVDLGGGVTVAFTGNIEVGIVDNHLGFYLGQKPVQASAIFTQAPDAGNLSFTFEDPIYAFTVEATDYNGNTTIRAYDASGQLIESTAVSGTDPSTYALTCEQPVAKVVISSTSGWVGTTEELARIIGQILSQLNGNPIQGVTVTIDPSNQQGVSDSNGNYTVTGVKPGAYSLTGTGIGIDTVTVTGIAVSAGETITRNIVATLSQAEDSDPVAGYSVTNDLWAKAVLEVTNSPVPLVWKMVGADITPSGDQVISGYFYADPVDFAYGSQFNPEVFVKIYIAANGWANMAFNHVTVDPVTVCSAHQYSGQADHTGSVTLQSRLLEHSYNGVAIDQSKQSSGWQSREVSADGYSLGSDLWSRALLQVANNPINLVWKEVGTDTTPSGAKVVSGYFYADPADFSYGSPYNPEVFVKAYIARNGWCNMAFNHVTVDPVSLDSAFQYAGSAQQSGSVTLNGRLLEHTYTGIAPE